MDLKQPASDHCSPEGAPLHQRLPLDEYRQYIEKGSGSGTPLPARAGG